MVNELSGSLIILNFLKPAASFWSARWGPFLDLFLWGNVLFLFYFTGFLIFKISIKNFKIYLNPN